MKEFPIVETVIGVIVGAAAIWKSLPQLTNMFKKDKKYIVINIPVSEFMQALKNNANYVRETFKIECGIIKKQKLDAQDASNIIRAKVLEAFERVKHENNIEDSIRIRFENALDCMLLNMRRDMYDEFEKNHFIERENWTSFLNNTSTVFYNKGYHEICQKFPDIQEMPDLYDEIKTNVQEFVKTQIECVFDNAKNHYIKAHDDIKKLDEEYEEEIKMKYIEA